MGVIEDIQRMQQEGKSEMEISSSLAQRGISPEQISNIISESRIKQAVSAPEVDEGMAGMTDNSTGRISSQMDAPAPGQGGDPFGGQPSAYSVGGSYSPQVLGVMEYSPPTSAGFEGMQPSILAQGNMDQASGEYVPAGQQQEYSGGGAYEQQQQPGSDSYAYEAYSQYQPYQESMSSDMISEIAEQVVAEKFMELQDKLENAIDFKTVAEAKINSVDERLRKIETIIDRLQLSLLQRVGEYVNDVKDIKFEMEETQKSFKALVPQLRKIHGGHEEHQGHHPGHGSHSGHHP